MSKKITRNKVALASVAVKWYSINVFKARLLIVIGCIACYGNTVFNDFSFDDDIAFTRNPYVQQGIAGIPGILTHMYIITQSKSADYRPIGGITYALEEQFFGNNAHAGHVINIILFIICCLIGFELLNKILSLRGLPVDVACTILMFYIVHPAHTEVVSSIKSRDEILSLTFAFLAMWFALKYYIEKELHTKYALISVAMLMLSFLSKLTSLPMVGVILLTGLFTAPAARKKAIYIFTAAMAGMAIIYVGFILHNLKRHNAFYETPLDAPVGLSIHLGTALETLLFYFKFIFIPFPFSFYYGYNTVPLIYLSNIQAVFSFILYSFILLYGGISFSRKELLGFFILAYLLSISLYANMLAAYPGIVGERVLFMPSFWFIGAVVIAVYGIGSFALVKPASGFSKKAILVFAVFIFSIYTWLTIRRNFEWKDTLTLISSDIGHLQNSTLANYFYAALLQETGEKATDTSRRNCLTMAKQYYRKALAVSPEYAEPYYKLGMIYEYDENRNDSAFDCFRKSYTLDTALPQGQFQLAKLYMLKGNYKEANPLFDMVYRKIPADTFTLFFYAQSLFFSGDTSRAFRLNNELLTLTPQSYIPYFNRGMFNKFSGNIPAAIPDLERALQMGCTEPALLNTLLNYYLQTGQTDKANALQKYGPNRAR